MTNYEERQWYKWLVVSMLPFHSLIIDRDERATMKMKNKGGDIDEMEMTEREDGVRET